MNANPRFLGIGLLGLAAWGLYASAAKLSPDPDDPNDPNNPPKVVVLLDPGHEGYGNGLDPGAVANVGGKNVYEADCNLAIVLAVKPILTNMGYDVRLTRSSNVSLSISERKGIISRLKPSLFVSVHHNSASQAAAGTITAVHDPLSYDSVLEGLNERLGQSIVAEVGEAMSFGRAGYRVYQATDVSLSGNRFGVLSGAWESKVPAVLLETAFMVDPIWQGEWARRKNEVVQNAATALAEGIRRFVANNVIES